ncbi:site-specific integrase [Planktomarina temperata]|nr:site-specific integrase [Planktomarina temperata]
MATIFKTKDGRWRAQVRKQGMPSKSKNFARKADANAWAAQMDAAMSGNAGTINAPSAMTMADIIQAYQRDVKIGRTTKANLERISRAIGNVPVRKFNETTVQAFVEDRLKEGITGATIGGDLSGLSSVLRYARRAKHIAIDDDIAAAARRGLTARKISTRAKMRSRIPTPEEFERVIAHIEANPKNIIPTAQIARFLRHSAMRLSEATSITIENIKHNEGAVFLPYRKTPTGSDTAATVPVLPEAMQILLEASQGRSEGRVWPYNSQSVSAAWARAAKAVGLQGLRLHDMRRAATTDLAKIGLSAPLIQTVTGHKSLSSLQHYLAISPEDFHKAYAAAKRQNDE